MVRINDVGLLSALRQSLGLLLTGLEEEGRNFMPIIDFFTRLIVWAVICSVIYLGAPHDVSSTVLVGWFGIGLALVMAFYNPSEVYETKDVWGLISLLILGCGIMLFILI